MPLSPDVISWILEFPVFIASLRDLLRKNPELRGQSEKLLDEAIARIQRYAELHFALRDWKTLHHDLHEMLIAFQNSTQFASLINTSEKLPSLRNVQTRWQIFETQSLDPFLAKKPELAHITPIEIPKKHFRSGRVLAGDLHAEVEQIERAIGEAVSRGVGGSSELPTFAAIQPLLADLQWLLEQGLISADTAIRQIAGDLADLSIELRAKLDFAGRN